MLCRGHGWAKSSHPVLVFSPFPFSLCRLASWDPVLRSKSNKNNVRNISTGSTRSPQLKININFCCFRQIPAAAMLIQCLWRCYAADKAFNSHATWSIYLNDVNSSSNNVNTPIGKVSFLLALATWDFFFFGCLWSLVLRKYEVRWIVFIWASSTRLCKHLCGAWVKIVVVDFNGCEIQKSNNARYFNTWVDLEPFSLRNALRISSFPSLF